MRRHKHKLIIFEGIATSGKTTLIEKLQKILKPRYSIAVFPEDETLMPIVKNKNKDIALHFLWDFIEKRLKRTKKDVLLVDRLYFTHIFRTKSSNKDFQAVEDFLLNLYDALVILLFVDENTIEKRIRKTEKLRGGDWGQGKKGPMEERIAYYANQQRILRRAIKESRVPHLVFNTTEMKWRKYADKIIDFTQIRD
jgi:thymidylate kinase